MEICMQQVRWECSLEQHLWGSKGGWEREKLNCDVIAEEVSVDPRRSSGAGMALQGCPDWDKGAGPLSLSRLSPRRGSKLRQGSSVWLRASAERDSAVSHQQPMLLAAGEWVSVSWSRIWVEHTCNHHSHLSRGMDMWDGMGMWETYSMEGQLEGVGLRTDMAQCNMGSGKAGTEWTVSLVNNHWNRSTPTIIMPFPSTFRF